MPTFWLTYKPHGPNARRGWPASEMTALVKKFQSDPLSASPLWRIASHQAARAGHRFFLFKQGADPRGIFGVGELIENPRKQMDPDDVQISAVPRARIRFEALVDPADNFLIDFEAVQRLVPEKFINAFASGNSIPEEIASRLEALLPSRIARAAQVLSDLGDDPEIDPKSAEDERERAFRAIRVRRGQPAFREALLNAYGGRCAITRCAVKDVLEAAHISAYRGPLTNHVTNGLLLRADVHTLFDCGLIAIVPTTYRVAIAEPLMGSVYEKLAGKKMTVPLDPLKSPSSRNLQRRYDVFRAQHAVVFADLISTKTAI